MELIVVVWNACLLTWHIYNWMIASDNEDYNQNPVGEVNIINIGGFTAMDEDSCFDNVVVLEGSFTPMDQA